jgi:hypothetical protein
MKLPESRISSNLLRSGNMPYVILVLLAVISVISRFYLALQ